MERWALSRADLDHLRAMPRAVLVTGAAGFAGSHLIDLLSNVDEPVTAWHRPGGSPPRDVAGVSWQAVDLLNRDAVAAAIAGLSPEVVYHCAGAPHVGHSWHTTESTFSANVRATHHVIEGLRQNGRPARVVVASSALVYASSDRPLREDDLIRPTSPYAVSKLAQELVAVDGNDDMHVSIARAFNHFGPRQSPDFVASGFARRIAEIEAGRGDAELAVGNLDARRDLTDVRDTVRAYRAIVERGRPGRVYNVCSGRAILIRDLLDMLLSRARVRIGVRIDANRYRPSDQPIVVGDGQRIRDEIGWTPVVAIERTLDDLIDYWRRDIAEAR
jgi:GDP-4-dehydro-6-deoxy-D-mannose reductase